VIEGDVSVNDRSMATGAAARISDERAIAIRANADSELILVDVSLR
jgi:redox-sensitive bicupin YhaK (pirin superfamily)